MVTANPTRTAEVARARALSRRKALHLQAERVKSGLIEARCGAYMRAFMDLLIRHGRPGINMPIRRCIGLLAGEAWLNVYEATAYETGLEGRAYVAELRTRLQHDGIDWYSRRRFIERLLRFPRDTRYAALNIGGIGPYTRYGSCCVLLDPKQWLMQATCFAGDSLLTCFDRSGKQSLATDSILELFAVAEDWVELALVHHAGFLRDQRDAAPAFDSRKVRNYLEHEESIFEIHLHGPLTKEQVQAVVIARRDWDALWPKYKRWLREGQPSSQEFDKAQDFFHLVELLDAHGIPLILAEGE